MIRSNVEAPSGTTMTISETGSEVPVKKMMDFRKTMVFVIKSRFRTELMDFMKLMDFIRIMIH